MPTDPQHIQSVFLAAVEISTEAERASFLDEACEGDAALRSRVEALLRAYTQPDSLLDQPTTDAHDLTPPATIEHESGGSASDEKIPLGFLAPATQHESLGRIGHYEVLQVLGHGGFGIVFRAFDDVLHRVVAVKVLSPHLATTSPARKRFLREARSSAQVRHENVVQVYEVGELPLPYIAMEFIPGETLQQRLDRTGPLDVLEVVRIGHQIAEGLAAAHANDLIHRDIKPGNVLLEGGQHRVKITDFGLARAADDASLSQSGIIAGTPMYMAPEQAKGETLDQRADLFSLGSVLYVMTSGRPPFRATGTLAVLKRVAEDAPRPIREIIPETPEWLCDIIAKLLAKDPADRYQSAREVADVLADCEAQLTANSKLKDFSLIPQGRTRPSGWRRWIAASAVVLLPLFALTVTEATGVTHLIPGPRAATRSSDAPMTKGPESPAPKPTKAVAGASFTRADGERISALPATEQVEEVRKELVRLNPGFDGSVEHKIENDVVTEITVVTDKVTDISPIRVFNRLRKLDLSGTHIGWHGHSSLSDLTPLGETSFDHLTYLNLAYTRINNEGLEPFDDCERIIHLDLDDTKVGDSGMEAFEDCKGLTYLHLGETEVGDRGLAYFETCLGLTSINLAGTNISDAGMRFLRGCKNLEWVNLSGTKVGDSGIGQLEDCESLGQLIISDTLVGDTGLAALKDCKKLWFLALDGTQVTNFSLLKEFPLRSLRCDFNAERDAEILRSMKTLEEINGKPVEEFWREVEAR